MSFASTIRFCAILTFLCRRTKYPFFADKEAKDKDKAAQSLAVPRLSVCADAQKVDRTKLAQTEVSKMHIAEERINRSDV